MLSGKQLLINTIEIYSSLPSILPQKWWHPEVQVRSNNVDEAVTGPHKDHYKDQVHGLASSQEVCVAAESLQCDWSVWLGGVLLPYLAILFQLARSPTISLGNDEVDAKSGEHEESVGEEVQEEVAHTSLKLK